MKILESKIQRRGKTIQIKTDDRGDYRYIWLEADNLKALADISERL